MLLAPATVTPHSPMADHSHKVCTYHPKDSMSCAPDPVSYRSVTVLSPGIFIQWTVGESEDREVACTVGRATDSHDYFAL